VSLPESDVEPLNESFLWSKSGGFTQKAVLSAYHTDSQYIATLLKDDLILQKK
jgi:hypothetical protein